MRRTMLAAWLATVTLAAGLAGPATAVAEPSGQGQPMTQLASAVPESSQEDKVRAAAVLSIVAGDDLLVLSDRNFVVALWQKVKLDPDREEVRASAELALNGLDVECTLWIKSGIHEAYQRDHTNNERDAAAARLAKELKQSAAAVIGIVPDDGLLVLSYKSFVYALWERATGPKVKAAALVAFGGDEEAQKEFLRNGIRDARAQDEQDKLDQDKESSEAEKARQAARDAKSRAASVVRIIAPPEMLELSDVNFVREIWNRATPGTEVAVAAERALRSSKPEDWKWFIDTGIYEADRRDDQIALKQKELADRRRATEILAMAENSRIHPAMVAAAHRALAGDHHDVDLFLRIGAAAAVTQSLRATTAGVQNSYVRDNGGSGRVMPRDPAGRPGSEGDMTWVIAGGLAEPTCISFESVSKPGYYLRQSDLKVQVAANDRSQAFARDATWCWRPGMAGSGMSVELFSDRTKVLRNYDGQLWAADKSGRHFFDNPTYFETDATWQLDWPDPNIVSANMLRWNNEDGLQASIGKPVAEEATDGDVRYRAFERGRLYWSPATIARWVGSGNLQVYLAHGGHRSSVLGVPVTDESIPPDGAGRYSHFAKGGSIYWSPASGSHLIYGGFKARWASMGWETSYLGYPTSDPFAFPRGQKQTFQGGWMEYYQDTGLVQVFRN
ncbi:AbfB domain-containing protein [Amycolatopsis nigrescens]|uniref:AbfB domain-containing protein n=1 Tax=Amycolatopsis nigrescens TaxID=381445 RepID=UPI0003AA8F78|nr:AbfB domain-containing protein [Amycolatopsis nigrescens]